MWNRDERHSVCEAVAHILHDHGNPTAKQWDCYAKLRRRFIFLNRTDPDLKQSNGLAKLAKRHGFKQFAVSDKKLCDLVKQ